MFRRIGPFIELARPRQWIKCLFVFTGYLYSRHWTDWPLLVDVVLAAASFALVSSAVYALNDILDRNRDRFHPKKSLRPIASGRIGIAGASVAAILWLGSGLALATMVSATVAATVLAYLALNIAYTLGLKKIAVLDVIIIATGFMLRILAGTIGVGIGPSHWLLVCALFLTLFLGFVKRRAEILELASGSEKHRDALSRYSPLWLDWAITLTATALVVTYGLYTISPETQALHQTRALVMTLPFVMYGVGRFVYLLRTRQGGGDPAADLLHDPSLALTTAGWFAATVWIIA